MKINLMPLYSRLSESGARSGVSLHQRATWDFLQNPDIDAVINMAATGDGKSYAAFGAFPEGGILALYPTNELVRDQQRQLSSYQKDWRVQRVTGADLDRWARSAKQSKAETLLDLGDSEVLLTNPDLFYYLHQGNYLKQWMGEKSGLWREIDSRFQAIVFDEFHLYSPSQVAGVLNTVLLMRAAGFRHKLVFLSATPHRYLLKALRLAGLNTAIVDPKNQGFYSDRGGVGWRQINQAVNLELMPTDRASAWIEANSRQILDFWLENPGSKGAIILNSVASAKRVKRLLSKLFAEHGLKVSENTGFTDYEEVQNAIAADLVVGTSTLDVGVDFRINWLLFEGHDAPSFIQRFGRLGRHPGFSTYQAIGFIPRYFYERLDLHCPEYVSRAEFSDLVFREHRQVQSFQRYYKRWAPVQAYGIARTIVGTSAVKPYLESVEALWGEPLKQIAAQVKEWQGEAEYAGLRKSNPIAQEAMSFRGTSSLNCAVITPTGSYTTYSLPSLLSNYSYRMLASQDFPRWFTAAQYCHLHMQVLDLLESRRFWHFYLPEHRARRLAGRIITLTGLQVLDDGSGNQISNRLGRLGIVAFIVPTHAEEVRQQFKLPLHFPLYDLQTQIVERYPIFSIAFDQAALMLDSLMGGGDVITRDMVAARSKRVLQEDLEEDDEFLRRYAEEHSARILLESWQAQADMG